MTLLLPLDSVFDACSCLTYSHLGQANETFSLDFLGMRREPQFGQNSMTIILLVEAVTDQLLHLKGYEQNISIPLKTDQNYQTHVHFAL